MSRRLRRQYFDATVVTQLCKQDESLLIFNPRSSAWVTVGLPQLHVWQPWYADSGGKNEEYFWLFGSGPHHWNSVKSPNFWEQSYECVHQMLTQIGLDLVTVCLTGRSYPSFSISFLFPKRQKRTDLFALFRAFSKPKRECAISSLERAFQFRFRASQKVWIDPLAIAWPYLGETQVKIRSTAQIWGRQKELTGPWTMVQFFPGVGEAMAVGRVYSGALSEYHAGRPCGHFFPPFYRERSPRTTGFEPWTSRLASQNVSEFPRKSFLYGSTPFAESGGISQGDCISNIL
jgi:hypothetical protein